MEGRSDWSQLGMPHSAFGFPGDPSGLQPQTLPAAFGAAAYWGLRWERGSPVGRGSRSASLPWRILYGEGIRDPTWDAPVPGELQWRRQGIDGMGWNGRDGMRWVGGMNGWVGGLGAAGPPALRCGDNSQGSCCSCRLSL